MAPQQIRIVPDIIGLILPWVTLIVGLILGGLVGIAIAYNVFRVKQKTEEPPKKKATAKKVPKETKVEKTTTEKKETEEEQQEEEKEKPTPRKIKRKL
jgi:cytoskeletal protein RodZ